MYSIHSRDDVEKLKELQESKSLLKAERLRKKLGKQDFHYDMEEVIYNYYTYFIILLYIIVIIII